MITRVTKDCASHHTNQDYVTLLVVFDGSETNTRPYGLTGDWQPRDAELLAITEQLADLSPTFRRELIKLAYRLDIVEPNTPSKPYNKRKVGSWSEYTEGMFL